MSKNPTMKTKTLPPPATPAPVGLLVRAAEVLLPCLLFAGVFWMDETPLICVIPMLLFFVAFFVWEIRQPLMAQQRRSWTRWPANGLLWSINVLLCSRIGMPIVLLAAARGVNYGSGWLTETFDSPVLITLITVMVLDVWHYFLHRLMHRWGWLWRMHRVHHSDRDFDLTTGLRFHPLEAVVTLVWMFIPMLLLGMPYYALLINAALTLTVDYFTHANVPLPPAVERWARKLLVTPALHRIHHSLHGKEDRTNFSTTFIIWDRMFGTYLARSAQKGPAPLTGVQDIPAERSHGVVDTLLMPFIR